MNTMNRRIKILKPLLNTDDSNTIKQKIQTIIEEYSDNHYYIGKTHDYEKRLKHHDNDYEHSEDGDNRRVKLMYILAECEPNCEISELKTKLIKIHKNKINSRCTNEREDSPPPCYLYLVIWDESDSISKHKISNEFRERLKQ